MTFVRGVSPLSAACAMAKKGEGGRDAWRGTQKTGGRVRSGGNSRMAANISWGVREREMPTAPLAIGGGCRGTNRRSADSVLNPFLCLTAAEIGTGRVRDRRLWRLGWKLPAGSHRTPFHGERLLQRRLRVLPPPNRGRGPGGCGEEQLDTVYGCVHGSLISEMISVTS
jgi:hypothetical protein